MWFNLLIAQLNKTYSHGFREAVNWIMTVIPAILISNLPTSSDRLSWTIHGFMVKLIHSDFHQ